MVLAFRSSPDKILEVAIFLDVSEHLGTNIYELPHASAELCNHLAPTPDAFGFYLIITFGSLNEIE